MLKILGHMISSLCVIFFLRHWDPFWSIFTAASARDPRDPFLQQLVCTPGIMLFYFCFCRAKMSPEGGALTGVEPSSCLHMMNRAKLPFRLIYCFTAAY